MVHRSGCRNHGNNDWGQITRQIIRVDTIKPHSFKDQFVLFSCVTGPMRDDMEKRMLIIRKTNLKYGRVDLNRFTFSGEIKIKFTVRLSTRPTYNSQLV